MSEHPPRHSPRPPDQPSAGAAFLAVAVLVALLVAALWCPAEGEELWTPGENAEGILDDFVPSRFSTPSVVIVLDETSCNWLLLAPSATDTPVFGTRIKIKPGGECEVRP